MQRLQVCLLTATVQQPIAKLFGTLRRQRLRNVHVAARAWQSTTSPATPILLTSVLLSRPDFRAASRLMPHSLIHECRQHIQHWVPQARNGVASAVSDAPSRQSRPKSVLFFRLCPLGISPKCKPMMGLNKENLDFCPRGLHKGCFHKIAPGAPSCAPVGRCGPVMKARSLAAIE